MNMFSEKNSVTNGRILVEALKQSKNLNGSLNLHEVASNARTTVDVVENTLVSILPNLTLPIRTLDTSARMQLALHAARNGLTDIAKILTWQEFEYFAARCLELAGFETVRGMVTHGQGRKWQIDLIGSKGHMLLVFDCKHWNSSYSSSRLQIAATHQREAIISMLNDVKCRKKFSGEQFSALPIILTLLEPQGRNVDHAVIVPIEKLSDFLNGITPYANEFPFIDSTINRMESSINL